MRDRLDLGVSAGRWWRIAPLVVVVLALLVPLSGQSPGAVPGSLAPSSENGDQAEGETPSDALNEGLGGLFTASNRTHVDRPAWNSRRSPRHALLTFFEAMDHAIEGKEQGWDRAFGVLPEGGSEDERRRRAMWLKEILDRLGRPSPLGLPGPGAVEDGGLLRYRYFPSSDFDWVWDRLDEPPRGRIELQKGEGPNSWTFASSTIEEVEELWQSTAALPPRHSRGLDDSVFAALVEPTLTQTPMMGWVLFGVSVGLGVLIGLFARRLLRWLREACKSKGWSIWAAATHVGGPVALAMASGGLAVGIEFVNFTPTLSSMLGGFTKIVFGLAAGWALLRLVDVIGAWLSRATKGYSGALDQTLVPLVIKTARVTLITLVVVVLLESALGVNITGFIAGIGLIGLALSLAAKDSVQNLFGALTIYLERPFQMGDVIRFRGSFGTVEEIGLRATTIRLLDGDIVYQPNMAFIADKVENVSVRSHIRREIDLALPYGTPPEKVEQAASILEEMLGGGELAESGRFDLEQYPPHISFDAFNDASLNLKVYYWYQVEGSRDSGWFDYLSHCQAVNLEILRRFGEAGIDFAFPTQTLHLVDEQGSRPETASEGRGEASESGRRESGDEAASSDDARRFDPEDAGESDGSDADDGEG